jgi:hypothetical protein
MFAWGAGLAGPRALEKGRAEGASSSSSSSESESDADGGEAAGGRRAAAALPQAAAIVCGRVVLARGLHPCNTVPGQAWRWACMPERSSLISDAW